MKKKSFLQSKQAGFTLIELMVSLMIFVVVVLAAVGSLYAVNNASRKVQSMRSVLDNLTFAIESISRTVRTANSIVCGDVGDCSFEDSGINTSIVVNNSFGFVKSVKYDIGIHDNGNGRIEKTVCEPVTADPNMPCFWSEPFSLTSPEINIKKLSFYVSGTGNINVDTLQPSVMMFVEGEAISKGEVSPFAIQTYISQRSTE